MRTGEADASLRMAVGGGAGGGVVAIASCVILVRSFVESLLSLVLPVAGIPSIGAAGHMEAAGSSVGITIVDGALASAGVMDSLVTTSTDL